MFFTLKRMYVLSPDASKRVMSDNFVVQPVKDSIAAFAVLLISVFV